MKTLYRCKTCGVVGKKSRDLCRPDATNASCTFIEEDYDFDPMLVCDPMVQKSLFFCDVCGRYSHESKILCRPRQY